ncbi:MAG: alanine--glyoxylate aminotransferase family protein [Desulfobacterales bacterium]|nr:alanine--glyoxylate aminotransferase family protein [Desulfobacterales bacterium]
MKRKRLMIPGPTEVSDEALECMSLPIQPHYGDKWMEIYTETQKKLRKIFKTENDIIIYTATGSGAIESAISSAIDPGDKVLICHNGYFSQRLIDMVQLWGGEPVILEARLNQSFDTSKVTETINLYTDLKMIAMVHVETSTGVENNIKQICDIANKNNIVTLVDCVASLGGTELNVDDWHVDFAATGSQKCFESPAGLSFLSVSEKAWDAVSQKKSKIGGWYLNLSNIRKYQKKWSHWHSHGPNTAPVSLYLALNVSLDRILKEGLGERIMRHEKMTGAVRKTLETLGLKLFADDKIASKTLTSFLLPEKINALDFIGLMREKYDIFVSGDVGYVDNQLIRLGHMGITASASFLTPTFEALEASLNSLNFEFSERNAKKIFTENI